MAQITAAAVKALRDQTGAGMMDCKKVLSEAGGDVKKAVELLREKGLAKAGKRVQLLVGEGYNHFEIIETLGNPFGLLGHAALAQMGITWP